MTDEATTWLPVEIQTTRDEFVDQAHQNEQEVVEIARAWYALQDLTLTRALEDDRPEYDAQTAIAAGDYRLAFYQSHYFGAFISGVQCTEELYSMNLESRYAFSWGHTELGLERSPPGHTEYIRRFNHTMLADPGHPLRDVCHAVSADEKSHRNESQRRRDRAEIERLIDEHLADHP